MRYRGHISSEAFPLNLELFLSGGAGAPLAPLAETPMVTHPDQINDCDDTQDLDYRYLIHGSTR